MAGVAGRKSTYDPYPAIAAPDNTLAGKVFYRVSIVQSLRKSVRANPFSGHQSYFTLLYFYIETSLDNREALDSLHLL